MYRCTYAVMTLIMLLPCVASRAQSAVDMPLERRVEAFFQPPCKVLAEAAAKEPDKKSFRKVMKPVVEKTEGFAGATLLDPDFVIRKTYRRSHAAAVGYDLKKTPSLKKFCEEMKKKPVPQISHPTRPRLMQPSVIVLRQPVINDGKLTGVLSLMILADEFLEKSGLADCPAYKVKCSDGYTFSKGKLSREHRHGVARLPSATWTIDYDLPKTKNERKTK